MPVDMPSEGMTLILFVNYGAVVQTRSTHSMGGYSCSMKRDSMELKWQSQYSDKRSIRAKRIVNFVSRGGHIEVLTRRQVVDPFVRVGDVSGMELLSEAAPLVAEGMEVVEECGGMIHKAIGPSCLHAALKSGIGLRGVKYNGEKMAGNLCRTCCFKPAEAVIRFSSFTEEAIEFLEDPKKTKGHGRRTQEAIEDSEPPKPSKGAGKRKRTEPSSTTSDTPDKRNMNKEPLPLEAPPIFTSAAPDDQPLRRLLCKGSPVKRELKEAPAERCLALSSAEEAVSDTAATPPPSAPEQPPLPEPPLSSPVKPESRDKRYSEDVVAKFQRIDEEILSSASDTDMECEATAVKIGASHVLKPCRNRAAWIAMPNLPLDKVLALPALDPVAVGARMAVAGWRCEAKNQTRWAFAGGGSTVLVLYAATSRLVIRSPELETAATIARQFVTSWLGQDEPK